MITFPNTKINIGLNITEKRPDGYHNLETIFYPINLQDALEVTPLMFSKQPYKINNSGIHIDGNPEKNLIVKAYLLIKEKYPQLPPIKINIFKNVPMGAGLGGGSSDAAFMIKLLNKKFNLGMSDKEMEEYASTLGADCAFFIKDKPTFASGIGNIFSDINVSLKGYFIVLVKPEIFVSTKDAFENIIPQKPEQSLKDLIKKPIECWKEDIKNDFELTVFKKHPELEDIKDKLYTLGAIYASMSGSGATLYGIFKAPIDNIKEEFPNCFCRQLLFEE